jgi:transposase-like protein
MKIHPMARTAPQIRAEIRSSPLSQREKARRYNVSRATIQKWEKREDVQDRSHRPHEMATSLSPAQETIVLEIRHLTRLPMEDLLVLIQKFMKPDMSYSALYRLLKRHHVPSLRQQAQEAAAEGKVVKSFKDYAPGFLHVDIKYLPKMPDESQHRYLFVAIDRATRWVFFKIHDNQTWESALAFLEALKEACPVRIEKILTDNGAQFTDRFVTPNKDPSGNPPFDQACAQEGITHRLIPPRHPQTHGRSNG